MEKFQSGEMALVNAPRSGRPPSAITEDIIKAVRSHLEENRRATIDELCEELGGVISPERMHKVLAVHLKLRKFVRGGCRMLSPTNKKVNVREFATSYAQLAKYL